MPTSKKSARTSSKRTTTKRSRTGARRPAQYADHAAEVKAAALAAMIAGQGLSETAREYKVPKTTLRAWRDKLPPDKLAQIRTKQGDRVDDMIGDYLEDLLHALGAQAQVAGDPKYIARQSASELAVLHGVMCDKGFRILEAVQRAADPQYDEPGDGGGGGEAALAAPAADAPPAASSSAS